MYKGDIRFFSFWKVEVILFVLISCFQIGCQKVVEVSLNNARPRLVIEGLITDQPGPYYIQLSLTGDFYDKSKPPAVSDAIVMVKDDLGYEEILTSLKDKSGVYQTTLLQGKPGRTYFLSVNYQGQVYSATAYMPFPVDAKLNAVIYNPGNTFRRKGYYVFFDLTFPVQPEKDLFYFRYYTYRNDTLYNRGNDIRLRSSTLLKTNQIKNWELSYAFDEKDTLVLYFHSLTKEAYDYYNQFRNLLNSDGGLFSPPPVNPANTISGQALGLFRASAVTKKVVVIQ